MNIGFIGCGNMAKAIIKGIIRAKVTESDHIYASDVNKTSLDNFCLKNQINAVRNNMELCDLCDIILLCVKPQNFPSVLEELRFQVHGKLIISIAAGKTISFIQDYLGDERIIRVMPNLNAAVSLSQTALYYNSLCETNDRKIATQIFASIGDIYEIDENDISAFSAVAGCSPAFYFLFIQSLADAAVNCGLNQEIALKAAIGAAKGSAELLQTSLSTPEELIRRVCSPGGTTIEGVRKLRQNGIEAIVGEAVKASYKKDKLL